jgi:hypothetical protein
MSSNGFIMLGFAALAAITGCAEAGPGATSGGGSDPSTTVTVGSGGATATTTTTTASTTSTGGAATTTTTTTATTTTTTTATTTTGAGGGDPAANLVINEISAKGDDWVEIGNLSGTDVVLAGLAIADDDGTGNPDMSNPTTFAAGASIPAHGYVLVLAGQNDDGGGMLQTSCLDSSGPASCYYTSWGISSSNGDEIFLLDASGAVLTSVPYPADAVPDGDSYGRLPDMTGAFTSTTPTPAAPNVTAP